MNVTRTKEASVIGKASLAGLLEVYQALIADGVPESAKVTVSNTEYESVTTRPYGKIVVRARWNES